MCLIITIPHVVPIIEYKPEWVVLEIALPSQANQPVGAEDIPIGQSFLQELKQVFAMNRNHHHLLLKFRTTCFTVDLTAVPSGA